MVHPSFEDYLIDQFVTEEEIHKVNQLLEIDKEPTPVNLAISNNIFSYQNLHNFNAEHGMALKETDTLGVHEALRVDEMSTGITSRSFVHSGIELDIAENIDECVDGYHDMQGTNNSINGVYGIPSTTAVSLNSSVISAADDHASEDEEDNIAGSTRRNMTGRAQRKKRKGRKPWSAMVRCKLCCKWVHSSLYLEKHLQQHMGKKLYSCDKCGEKFTFRMACRYHRESCDGKYKVWVKPSAEQQFLYGHHVMKSGLGRITESTPQYQGIVVYSMADLPLGFGVAAKSTQECRHTDPMTLICFHQADIGEYIRSEDTHSHEY